MSQDWIHEEAPVWDAGKVAVIGGAPAGAFTAFEHLSAGDSLPGDWWRLEEDGQLVGYGWMDCTWGEAEILLAVHPDRQGRGAGAVILDHLEREASAHGLNYMTNVVSPTHPRGEQVTRWLRARGFEEEGDYLRRRVRPARS